MKDEDETGGVSTEIKPLGNDQKWIQFNIDFELGSVDKCVDILLHKLLINYMRVTSTLIIQIGIVIVLYKRYTYVDSVV